MFVGRCLKASLYFTKHVRQFSMIKINEKSSLKFPYNFYGIDNRINTEYSQMYQGALEEIFDTDVKEGFKFAYRATLEAFLQKDFEYFKETCEPNLYYEIEKGLLSLNEMNLELEGENFDKDTVKVAITSFKLLYGVHHRREDNYSESHYVKKGFSLGGINMEVYQLNANDPEYIKKLCPMIQVGCVFYSPRNLLLKNKEGDVIGGSTSNGYHKIIFESTSESEEPEAAKNIQNIFHSATGIIGAINLLRGQKSMKGFLQKLFGANESIWKIADIDDHLNGNPFLS